MTAFARKESQGGVGHLTCEMRSINHRYLEIGVYLPEILRVLEMPIREHIRELIKRGKIECTIRYQPSANVAGSLFQVNMVLAKELCHASERIAGFLNESAPICPTDILRYPGVLETKEADFKLLQKDLFLLLEKTLQELILARKREGEELKQLFIKRIGRMKVELTTVHEQLPSVLHHQRERLMKRFSEVKSELDPTRLEQEMLIFTQKIDVSEEIERTETHLVEMERVLLKQEGAVGRRLDFLLQELNREANTLASKSVDSMVTHAAVEMKVLIEQMREQIQNIE